MIVGVHGFGFPEPGSPADTATQLGKDWESMTGQPVTMFPWYSAPIGVDAVARALLSGFPDTYAWAYKSLAIAAAKRLAELLKEGVSLLGHSLGSRTIMQAIQRVPEGSVSKILLLDGAEIQSQIPATLPAGATVLNCCVREDLVLKDLGSKFNDIHDEPCIGQAGLGRSMPGWLDICLDCPETIDKAKSLFGWDIGASPRHKLITGDIVADLRNLGNHWSSYSNEGNHKLYRAFFAGEDLSQLAP